METKKGGIYLSVLICGLLAIVVGIYIANQIESAITIEGFNSFYYTNLDSKNGIDYSYNKSTGQSNIINLVLIIICTLLVFFSYYYRLHDSTMVDATESKKNIINYLGTPLKYILGFIAIGIPALFVTQLAQHSDSMDMLTIIGVVISLFIYIIIMLVICFREKISKFISGGSNNGSSGGSNNGSSTGDVKGGTGRNLSQILSLSKGFIVLLFFILIITYIVLLYIIFPDKNVNKVLSYMILVFGLIFILTISWIYKTTIFNLEIYKEILFEIGLRIISPFVFIYGFVTFSPYLALVFGPLALMPITLLLGTIIYAFKALFQLVIQSVGWFWCNKLRNMKILIDIWYFIRNNIISSFLIFTNFVIFVASMALLNTSDDFKKMVGRILYMLFVLLCIILYFVAYAKKIPELITIIFISIAFLFFFGYKFHIEWNDKNKYISNGYVCALFFTLVMIISFVSVTLNYYIQQISENITDVKPVDENQGSSDSVPSVPDTTI